MLFVMDNGQGSVIYFWGNNNFPAWHSQFMKQGACFTRVVSLRQYGGFVRFVNVCKVLFGCPKNTQVQWFIVNRVTISSLCYILSYIALYFNPAHKDTGYFNKSVYNKFSHTLFTSLNHRQTTLLSQFVVIEIWLSIFCTQ